MPLKRRVLEHDSCPLASCYLPVTPTGAAPNACATAEHSRATVKFSKQSMRPLSIDNENASLSFAWSGGTLSQDGRDARRSTVPLPLQLCDYRTQERLDGARL